VETRDEPTFIMAQKPKRGFRRFVFSALLAAAALAVVLAGGGAVWLGTSVPPAGGSYVIDGLGAEVQVFRDERGVPHIFARSANDAYAALGFLHAQDRLWQMESMRRAAGGRLAEVLGARALDSDRLMRTLGFQQLVGGQFERLEPEVRSALTAYAAGVNAWLGKHRRALPPEFVVLRFEPEPWRPTDSLLWAKLMALRLSANWRDELTRARMARTLSPEKVDEFWYPNPSNAPQVPPPKPIGGELYRDLPLDRLAAAVGGVLGAPAEASNAWAVTGDRSSTGNAILANDPHLGFSAPVSWYLARIETPDVAVTGATVAGVPFTILGHNRSIAWGMTSAQSDVTDLFVERPSAVDSGAHDTPAGPQPFQTRSETIRVRGGEDVTLRVRQSRHGPIVSDLLQGFPGLADGASLLALAAPFLAADDLTPQAVYKLNRARDWDSFQRALMDFHAPHQNVVYGDVGGNIGFFAPGRVPIRRSAKGRLPAPGWTGEADWVGFVPYGSLPKAFAPPENRIVTANHRIVSGDYPFDLGNDWAPPYRAQRIFQLLDETPKQTLETTARIQRDTVSHAARHLTPLLLLQTDAAGPRGRSVLALIRDWDGEVSRRRPEPVIFTAWLRELNRAIYADDLGELFPSAWDLRPEFIASVLTRHPAWCDDVETEAKEDCATQLGRSLERAMGDLSERFGTPFLRWRWGDLHRARFAHSVFSGWPVIGGFADLEVAADGDGFTVNRTAIRVNDPERPYAGIHGAGFRAIYDLSELGRSRFIVATGQSGNPLSRHYSDMLDDWRDGRYHRLGLSRRELEARQAGVIRLLPAGLALAERPADG
jgi:penicillin amidase